METLLLAGLLLGVVNAVVRPIAFILTLPLTIVTLGLFLFVLNAAMVGLVAWILPGFHLYGGFRAAVLTWIIVWLTGWLGSALIGHNGFERYDRRRSPL
jgi:putative membrane protein